MGVNLGGFEFGVPEHLLDEADVRAVLQHERRAGVAEQMASAALAQVGRLHVPAHQLGQPVRGEGFAQAGEEQGRVLDRPDQAGTHVFLIAFHPLDRPLPDRDQGEFI